jgi:phosphoribosylanthranilate isomerase
VRTRIKFCGCTTVSDVTLAVQTGADAVGLIFAPSPRQVSEEAAREIAQHLPAFITPVGVFVNPAYEELALAKSIFPDLVYQLHGDESPAFVSSIDGKVIKAIHVDPADADAERIEAEANSHPRAIILFDTKVDGAAGGTGVTFPWRAIAQLARTRPVMVGGGLTPDNVSNCVRTVRPYGVDVRNGIETNGRKDALKMRMFVQAVKDTDAA